MIFFLQRYPQVRNLHALSTQDIDDFIVQIKADVQRRGLKNSNTHVSYHIQALAGWLSYLERTEHTIKPQLPLSRIIWPHHYPPLDHSSPSTSIKYIPQSVLDQLDKHLHKLTPTYIPVMIILRASGWRISDVLALKWATCLEQHNVKYPRRIETHFRSPQLDLWQLSETEWLLALRQPERKKNKRRRAPVEILQLRLPEMDAPRGDQAL